MTDNPNLSPLDKGYFAGLGMAQGDLMARAELDRMLVNYGDADPEFLRGLAAGKEEGNRIRIAREDEQRRGVSKEIDEITKSKKRSHKM